MKAIILATAILIQYGQRFPEPPMWRWDRERQFEEDRRFPGTHTGPNAEECIMYGQCRGRQYYDDPDQSWRRPRTRPTCYETGEC